MSDLHKEFQYFLDNHDILFNKFPDKYIVISGEKVLYDAFSFDEALAFALEKNLEPGTFLIQECGKGEDSYTQSFSSRVVFV